MQVENIQRRQTVRRLIRAGEKMTNIMRQTGLKETEIIQIKRKMEKTTSLKKGTVLGE